MMRKQRSGHILNLLFVRGFMGFDGASVYCAAKFAVGSLSESLALEVAALDIHVTICPAGPRQELEAHRALPVSTDSAF
jgi:short-subunit dehydrogenase